MCYLLLPYDDAATRLDCRISQREIDQRVAAAGINCAPAAPAPTPTPAHIPATEPSTRPAPAHPDISAPQAQRLGAEG